MKHEVNISRSDLTTVIDEWILNERNRNILKRRLIDGITYESLAEEFDLSTWQVKHICYKEIDHIKKHI